MALPKQRSGITPGGRPYISEVHNGKRVTMVSTGINRKAVKVGDKKMALVQPEFDSGGAKVQPTKKRLTKPSKAEGSWRDKVHRQNKSRADTINSGKKPLPKPTLDRVTKSK